MKLRALAAWVLGGLVLSGAAWGQHHADRALAMAAESVTSQAAADRDARDAAAIEEARDRDRDRADPGERRLLLTLRVPPPHYRPEASYGSGYQTAPGREARRRLARAIARAHGLRVLDDWAMPALGVDCFVLEATDAATRARELPKLAADPRVESVQPVQQFHILADALLYEDPLAAIQPTADWHLQELHAITTGRNIAIAVLDSGADIAHPDLRGQRLKVRNFIDGNAYASEDHGTAVAGIIVARAGDGVGIAGIAPRARMLALRTCAQHAPPGGGAMCDSFSLAKALQFALLAKVKVLNLSLTGPPDPLLARLLDVAMARGIVVVAAVDARVPGGGFPATHPGVVAVAGMRQPGPLPAGAVRAPDRGIPVPRPGGGWELVSGTSFAAAQVSGLVALLRELSPRLGTAQLRAALVPPTELGLQAKRPSSVDACAAVRRVAGRCACHCPEAQAATTPRR